jgi:hypothetical protein
MNFLCTVDPFESHGGSGGFTDFWHRLLDFRVAELQRLKSTAQYVHRKKNTISSQYQKKPKNALQKAMV